MYNFSLKSLHLSIIVLQYTYCWSVKPSEGHPKYLLEFNFWKIFVTDICNLHPSLAYYPKEYCIYIFRYILTIEAIYGLVYWWKMLCSKSNFESCNRLKTLLRVKDQLRLVLALWSANIAPKFPIEIIEYFLNFEIF